MTVAQVRSFLDRANERFGAIRLLAPLSERAQISSLAAGLAGIEWFAELQPWIAAIAESKILVAPDSGAIHVAGMLGTPCIAVFEDSPEFELQRARWQPWAAPSALVRGDVSWNLAAADALVQLDTSGAA